MEINLNKSKTLIALILLFAIAASTLTVLPPTAAHDPPWEIPTWAYLSTSPTTVGVNEPALLIMWLNIPPPTAQGRYGDRWAGFTVDVTRPDGSKETLGPFTSDPVGSYATLYTPDQVGTYTMVFNFAGDTLRGENLPTSGYVSGSYDTNAIFGYDNINDTYLASQSDPVYLTVQQNPIPAYDETPVPTGFWNRPINGANRLWSAVAGNWLDGAAQNVGPTERFAFGKGPESAHVMWTRPFWEGGIMDERFGDISYYTGLDYEKFWDNPLIMNGKLYYNVDVAPSYGWYCVDLLTGETDFFHNTTGPIISSYEQRYDWNEVNGLLGGQRLSFGQILDFESPNQHGGFPYLWSTPYSSYDFTPTGNVQEDWMMFDAFTGNYICSIANVSDSGTQVYGKDGSILYYNIVGTSDPNDPWGPQQQPFYLQVWNSTRAIWFNDPWYGVDEWLWRPFLNVTFDGNNGFALNVPIPDVSGGDILAVREGQFVLVGASGKNNGTFVQEGWIATLNLDPAKGEIGQMLKNTTYIPPEQTPDVVSPGFYGGAYQQGPFVDPEDGVFIFKDLLTRQWFGFSLETGEQIWGPTASEQSWGFYDGMDLPYSIYDGKLLSYGYSGVLTAYDIKTGTFLWNWTSDPIGLESYYPYTPLSLGTIADGKIYLVSWEHSPNTPLRRDAQLWCVNIADGQLLWKIQHWGSSPAIGDGYLVDLNNFDNQIYCFGKGPSATTVSTPDTAIPLGTEVLIKGTVTDQTPSAEAKGTPAISDVDQEAWMEYLYQQRPMPTDATGVEVHLTAIDPNGNFQEIGTVTSDSNGNYGITWTPPVPGTYKVVATFDGSKSYGGSSATSYFAVAASSSAAISPAPTVTTPPPSQAEAPASGTSTATYIAIAAVVVIIAVAAAAVLLRRRK
ncbi:MAG: PQQ-binding-like beta-propeller repeat protein [Candidatus Bathyarchaeota archaeon]|nr:PQQ-binding-like beta-propeller repeat protein [Candidatus Bathyarchaeota archaeon]